MFLADPQRPQSLQALAKRDGAPLYLMRGPPLPDPASDELHRQNARLRDTLDAKDATVVVCDRDRRYVLGNRACHTMFPHLPPDHKMIGLVTRICLHARLPPEP